MIVLSVLAFLYGHVMGKAILVGGLVLSLVTIFDKLGYFCEPKIKNVFEIPGYPIVGNLFQTLDNPARVYINWMKRYGNSIFQIKLGNKRVLVVNKFEDVCKLWSQTSMNSRPVQYTFHNLVSSTKGFTVGTTPFGNNYQKRKQVISLTLNEKNIGNVIDMLDAETTHTIKNIFVNHKKLYYQPSTNPNFLFDDINLLQDFQYFTLRTSVFLTYGFKLDCYNRDRDLANDIIKYENQIIKFRSPIANLADFFPLIRVFDKLKSNHTIIARKKRDEYLNILYRRGNYQDVQQGIIKDHFENNNPKDISFDDLQSICLTMVSAGLDNTPLNLDHMLGQLSIHPSGRKYQKMIVDELMLHYKSPLECWKNIPMEMKSNIAIAFIKETLRYFSVLPLSLPRVNTKPIYYKGITIPENTTLFMNAYAANHDDAKFVYPYDFNPFRWLKKDVGGGYVLLSDKLINHFAFGKGVRMCSGNILAFKEMYILLCRLLICFKIRQPRDITKKMKADPFENNSNPRATSFDPVAFKYQLQPRQGSGQDDLFNYLFTT